MILKVADTSSNVRRIYLPFFSSHLFAVGNNDRKNCGGSGTCLPVAKDTLRQMLYNDDDDVRTDFQSKNIKEPKRMRGHVLIAT